MRRRQLHPHGPFVHLSVLGGQQVPQELPREHAGAPEGGWVRLVHFIEHPDKVHERGHLSANHQLGHRL